jgi:hypothetical protein
MCYQQDITDPSLRLHFWQQLVLPVVSFGSELWAGLIYPFCDDASYMANNPSEQVHMQFLRWYLGDARGSTHKRILLHAAHRLSTYPSYHSCKTGCSVQYNFGTN